MEHFGSMGVHGTYNVFFSFSIFHGHSITKFLVHKNIFNVWKPTMLCNGVSLGSTSENEFTRYLLISVMISVGSSSMSPIICLIRFVSISRYHLTGCFFMFRSIMLRLLLAKMMLHKEHQKQRSICDFHQM